MSFTIPRKRKFSELVANPISYNSIILSEIRQINAKLDMKYHKEIEYKERIKKLEGEIEFLKNKLKEKQIENYNYFA